MTFSWTAHRFIGGALALDVANSVILRHLPARREDRFADAAVLSDFTRAASAMSGDRHLFAPLAAVDPADTGEILALREAVDAYFRSLIAREDDPHLLADLLEHIAAALRREPLQRGLLGATARSALRLVSGGEAERMKICGHCGWLFLDRSKNRSRIWCDMAVCGNREKASRHYAGRRVRGREAEKEDLA